MTVLLSKDLVDRSQQVEQAWVILLITPQARAVLGLVTKSNVNNPNVLRIPVSLKMVPVVWTQ